MIILIEVENCPTWPGLWLLIGQPLTPLQLCQPATVAEIISLM